MTQEDSVFSLLSNVILNMVTWLQTVPTDTAVEVKGSRKKADEPVEDWAYLRAGLLTKTRTGPAQAANEEEILELSRMMISAY